jgi:hypothetical protein
VRHPDLTEEDRHDPAQRLGLREHPGRVGDHEQQQRLGFKVLGPGVRAEVEVLVQQARGRGEAAAAAQPPSQRPGAKGSSARLSTMATAPTAAAPLAQRIQPTTAAETVVPRNAKKQIAPRFWKNLRRCMLYLDSKMIGGSSTRKKKLPSKRATPSSALAHRPRRRLCGHSSSPHPHLYGESL